MKIIAFANQKGGVGKTTSTYNIAYAKAREGKSVLMVDLDPQANLTSMCGRKPGKDKYSVCDLFDGNTDPYECGYEVEAVGLDNLYIIPSRVDLAALEQALTGRIAREKCLKKQLWKFDGQFDYIMIDCPPQLGILTANAFVAATDVVVVTKAEYLSYIGLRALKSTINSVREEYNPGLTLRGFVVTMYERVINDQRDMLEQFEREGEVLGVVKKSADAYRSILEWTPVVMSAKNSDVAVAYIEVAKKI